MLVTEEEGRKVVKDTYHFLRQVCTYHRSDESINGRQTNSTTDRYLSRLLIHGEAFCKMKYQLQNQPMPLRLASLLDEIEYSYHEKLKQEH